MPSCKCNTCPPKEHTYGVKSHDHGGHGHHKGGHHGHHDDHYYNGVTCNDLCKNTATLLYKNWKGDNACKNIKAKKLECCEVVLEVPCGKQMMLQTVQGWTRDGKDEAVDERRLNVAIVDRECNVYGLSSKTHDSSAFDVNVVLDEGDKLVAWQWGGAADDENATDQRVPPHEDENVMLWVSFIQFDKSEGGCYYKILRNSNYKKGMGVVDHCPVSWTVPCDSTAKLATIGLGDESSEAAEVWLTAITTEDYTFKYEILCDCHRMREFKMKCDKNSSCDLRTYDDNVRTRTLGPNKTITLDMEPKDPDIPCPTGLASSYLCFFVKRY